MSVSVFVSYSYWFSDLWESSSVVLGAVALPDLLSLCLTHQGCWKESKGIPSLSLLGDSFQPLPPLHPHSSLELIMTSSQFYSLLPQCPLALSDRLQVYTAVSDESLAGVLVTHSQMPG